MTDFNGSREMFYEQRPQSHQEAELRHAPVSFPLYEHRGREADSSCQESVGASRGHEGQWPSAQRSNWPRRSSSRENLSFFRSGSRVTDVASTEGNGPRKQSVERSENVSAASISTEESSRQNSGRQAVSDQKGRGGRRGPLESSSQAKEVQRLDSDASGPANAALPLSSSNSREHMQRPVRTLSSSQTQQSISRRSPRGIQPSPGLLPLFRGQNEENLRSPTHKSSAIGEPVTSSGSYSRSMGVTRDGAATPSAVAPHNEVSSVSANISNSSTTSYDTAEKKLQQFRLAREQGKSVCVCAASAYYERERVAISTERARLRQESEKLRSELVAMRESRQTIAARLVDLEENERRLAQRDALVTAREAAVDSGLQDLEERQRKMREERDSLKLQQSEVAQAQRELEKERNSFARERERERSAYTRDVEALKEERSALRTESERLRDLSRRIETRETELAESERALAAARSELESKEAEAADILAMLEAERSALSSGREHLADEESRIQKMREDVEQRLTQLKQQAEALTVQKAAVSKLEASCQKDSQAIARQKQQLEVQTVMIKAREKNLRQEEEECEKQRKRRAEEFEQNVQKQRQEIEQQLAAAKALSGRLSDKEQRLQQFREELDQRAQLLQQEESETMEAKNEIAQEAAALQERVAKLEYEEARLQSQQQDLESRAARMKELETQLNERGAQLDRWEKDVEERERTLAGREEIIAIGRETNEKRERELAHRERALESQEGRCEWRQAVRQELADAKERYELLLQDFELEKRSFEEMKQQTLASQERSFASLKAREESLASLEWTLQQRSREVARREQVLNARLAEASLPTKYRPLTLPTQDSAMNSGRRLRRSDSFHDSQLSSTATTLVGGERVPPLSRMPSLSHLRRDADSRGGGRNAGLSERSMAADDFQSGSSHRPPSYNASRERMGNRTMTSEQRPKSADRAALSATAPSAFARQIQTGGGASPARPAMAHEVDGSKQISGSKTYGTVQSQRDGDGNPRWTFTDEREPAGPPFPSLLLSSEKAALPDYRGEQIENDPDGREKCRDEAVEALLETPKELVDADFDNESPARTLNFDSAPESLNFGSKMHSPEQRDHTSTKETKTARALCLGTSNGLGQSLMSEGDVSPLMEGESR